MDRTSGTKDCSREKENLEKLVGKRRKPIVTQWSEGQIFFVYRHKNSGKYKIECPNEEFKCYEYDNMHLLNLIFQIHSISQRLQRIKKIALFQFIQDDIE